MKALFFDLDGTLLDSSKRIPGSAKAALREARARGVKVFLATARSPRLGETLGWTEDEFSLFNGGVYSNGGYVEADGQSHYAFIDADVVAECVRAVQEEQDVHFSLHSPGHGYTFNFPMTENLRRGWGITESNLRPLDADTMSHTAKILVFWRELVGETQLLPARLHQRLQAVCQGRAHLYLTDGGATMQITALAAGKLAAIRRLQKQLGLADEEIAVFGDDLNDLEMISGFPVSIAMGNGAQTVKDAARYVTRANDDDGVAYALKHLLHIV